MCRDPLNVAVSYYNFFNGWFFEKDTISMDEFVVEFFAARGLPQTSMNNASYWHNLTSWYPHRKDENVLWMHYEDLMDDLPACVDMISQFLGIGVRDEELKAKTVHQVFLMPFPLAQCPSPSSISLPHMNRYNTNIKRRLGEN